MTSSRSWKDPHVLRHPNHRRRPRRNEAAWQLAEAGFRVRLSEMRGGGDTTPAHETDRLAEMVCSNSFRSDDAEHNAVGLLHQEMRALGSLIMRSADAHRVPAGSALAVDREAFAAEVTRAIDAASQHHHGPRTGRYAARSSGDHRHRAVDRLGAGRSDRRRNRARTPSPSSMPSPRSSIATASTWTSPGWRRGGTRAARTTSTARSTRRSTTISSPR